MRLLVSLVIPSIMLSSALQAQSIAASADAVMKSAEARGFSGVVRLAKNGEIVFEKAYGLANRVGKLPFTTRTIVQIGSNTKDFTAVSILQLQDHGKLNLNDELVKYFPAAPADKQKITIRQLMNHRAGFPLGIGSGDFEPVSSAEFMNRAFKFKLLFTPGERESYSNTGFSILAAIIEKVSGKTYDHYVQDNILTPLGLTHTGLLLPGFGARDLAHGYRANGDDAGTMLAKPHATDGPYWNLRGNGGMLSTVADMHAFYKALFETDKLLAPATRNLRFDPSKPIALAGSDVINFFLYEREPLTGVEMIIASTNANVKAPEVRRELARIMGLPAMNGPRAGSGAGLARAKGTPVPEVAAKVIREYIATINTGDAAALRSFIAAHFASGPGAPSVDDRMERQSGMHVNLGNLTILQMSLVGDGSTQVVVKTEREGEALMIVEIDRAAPYKIKRIGLQIGG